METGFDALLVIADFEGVPDTLLRVVVLYWAAYNFYFLCARK
jgi:hypothetical protein